MLPGQLAGSRVQPTRGHGEQAEGRGQGVSPSLLRGVPGSNCISSVVPPEGSPLSRTPFSFCPARPRAFDSVLLLPVSGLPHVPTGGFRSCATFITSSPYCLLLRELPGVGLYLTDTGWVLRMRPYLLGFMLDRTSEQQHLGDQQRTQRGQPLNARAVPHPGLAYATTAASPLPPSPVPANITPLASLAGFPSTFRSVTT